MSSVNPEGRLELGTNILGGRGVSSHFGAAVGVAIVSDAEHAVETSVKGVALSGVAGNVTSNSWLLGGEVALRLDSYLPVSVIGYVKDRIDLGVRGGVLKGRSDRNIGIAPVVRADLGEAFPFNLEVSALAYAGGNRRPGGAAESVRAGITSISVGVNMDSIVQVVTAL